MGVLTVLLTEYLIVLQFLQLYYSSFEQVKLTLCLYGPNFDCHLELHF